MAAFTLTVRDRLACEITVHKSSTSWQANKKWAIRCVTLATGAWTALRERANDIIEVVKRIERRELEYQIAVRRV